MDALHVFDFEHRTWSKRACNGGHETWTFGHAVKRGRSLFALGTLALSEAETAVEVWSLLRMTVRLKLGRNLDTHTACVHWGYTCTAE